MAHLGGEATFALVVGTNGRNVTIERNMEGTKLVHVFM